jgi:hypothetical protein
MVKAPRNLLTSNFTDSLLPYYYDRYPQWAHCENTAFFCRISGFCQCLRWRQLPLKIYLKLAIIAEISE